MILKHGWIIEQNNLIKKDIQIKDGSIVRILDSIEEEDEILDAADCLIIPGAIDVHVHLREPGFSYKETIETGTMSAAKGGITTLLAMANLNPVPDSIANLEVEQELLKKNALVQVYPYCALSKKEMGKELAELEELCKRVYAISDDGIGVNNIGLLKEAMLIAKKHNVVIASHAEDLVDSKKPAGEYVAVRREIELAKEIGCRYHFCHLSTAESFQAVRQAHQQGYSNITCEVSPHHLLLNEEMIQDGNWKMNPPLRAEKDRLATVEALLDGTASLIASDHAPHSEEEKKRSYEKCPNGIIGLETMVPLIYTNFIETNLAPLSKFLDWLVYKPMELFGLPVRRLEVGYPADIAVLDIKKHRVYTKEEIKSLGKNSPFIGRVLTGFPRYTLVNGKVVWREEK